MIEAPQSGNSGRYHMLGFSHFLVIPHSAGHFPDCLTQIANSLSYLSKIRYLLHRPNLGFCCFHVDPRSEFRNRRSCRRERFVKISSQVCVVRHDDFSG
jgi:hypothetical protein